MQLTSGQPFWITRDGVIQAYPRLKEDLTTQVVVLGAGITGSLIADRLSADGFQVAVLDRRDVGSGSTSASTALLQYEIDTPLTQLIEHYGVEQGVAAYRGCLFSIDEVGALDAQLGGAGKFSYQNSFYFASNEDDLDDLKREYECRREHDFPVEFWDAGKIAQEFDFPAAGAIFSRKAGQLDAYRLAHALLKRVSERGCPVFDRTQVVEAEWNGEHVVLKTADGQTVRAKSVVVAMGYESQTFLPRPVAHLHNTFAFVSQPLPVVAGWPERCQVWETSRPYLYLRGTDDLRMMAGGGDISFRSPTARALLLERKVSDLLSRVQKMFPRIDLEIDFSWAGTFAETADGLPFIGSHPARPGLFFAMCYGGNGVTYSQIAASILSRVLAGSSHPLQELFGFGRLSRMAAWG